MNRPWALFSAFHIHPVQGIAFWTYYISFPLAKTVYGNKHQEHNNQTHSLVSLSIILTEKTTVYVPKIKSFCQPRFSRSQHFNNKSTDCADSCQRKTESNRTTKGTATKVDFERSSFSQYWAQHNERPCS